MEGLYTDAMAKVRANIPKHKVELQTQQCILDGLRASTPLQLGDHIWPAIAEVFQPLTIGSTLGVHAESWRAKTGPLVPLGGQATPEAEQASPLCSILYSIDVCVPAAQCGAE